LERLAPLRNLVEVGKDTSARQTPSPRVVGALGVAFCENVEGPNNDRGFFERMTRQAEEAIGKLAQELLENPVVTGALSAAMETRERAMRAQEAALGALNLPSASDLERLTRRLRSVSQRLEGVEDVLDRVERRVEGLDDSPLEQRLAAIEAALERIEAALHARAGS